MATTVKYLSVSGFGSCDVTARVDCLLDQFVKYLPKATLIPRPGLSLKDIGYITSYGAAVLPWHHWFDPLQTQ